MSVWVVVCEWGLRADETGGFETSVAHTLLEALSDLDPVALCQPDRFALQVRIEADRPVEAINRALARQETAARGLAPEGELIRIEVLTPAELDEEWADVAYRPDGPAAAGLLAEPAADPASVAEAALDRVRGPMHASQVLTYMVHQFGGGVVAARPDDEWTFPFDLSFGAGEPRIPIAEPWSVARMHLEEALPRLVSRANEVLLRDLHDRDIPAD